MDYDVPPRALADLLVDHLQFYFTLSYCYYFPFLLVFYILVIFSYSCFVFLLICFICLSLNVNIYPMWTTIQHITPLYYAVFYVYGHFMAVSLRWVKESYSKCVKHLSCFNYPTTFHTKFL